MSCETKCAGDACADLTEAAAEAALARIIAAAPPASGAVEDAFPANAIFGEVVTNLRSLGVSFFDILSWTGKIFELIKLYGPQIVDIVNAVIAFFGFAKK